MGVSASRKYAIAARSGAPEPIRLHGHSGAQLLLLARGTAHVVRKTAGAVCQNERLLAQAEQQHQLHFSGVAVPRIFETGIDASGHAFFEMEYVPGQSVANAVGEAMVFDPGAVVAALSRLFDFLKLTANGTVPAAAFHAKIAQIAATDNAACRGYGERIAGAAGRLAAFDWSGIPQSAGHGDLTLENILISPSGVIFIDCDVCFSSSYWLDAAKLFQDVHGHWCLRQHYRRGGPALVNAIQQMRDFELPLRRLAGAIDRDLPERLASLTAFHLFRTLPYVREAAIAGFVLDRLERVLS
jgi:tRNA A-37 threonylcarbamoyl transferase component Bud32